MKVTGMNRTTEQRNLLRIYSIDKKENSICLQICSNKTEEKIEVSQKKGDSDMAEFDYEVVNGRKIRVRPVETVSEVDENGYFVRQPNHFTEGFGEGKNLVEAGRYRLVWAKLCHWSNRASIVRELLGLDEAISVNMVDHAEHEKNLGWEFVYEDYWENVYYDIVVQETDWDTIWSQPTGREALSKDPAHKWKAEI